MARLCTNHDPYHVHKVLGAAVLLHFLYRLATLCRCGTAFPPSEPAWRASAGVLVHGLLSWSSLLLPLPAKRNFASPMIWPEFRLHSIAFATRHVVATLLTLNDAWPANRWGRAAAALALVLATSQIASWITDRYGDREQRTTNAMPYPDGVTETEKAAIKWSYAKAQFSATASATLSDATVNWIPLLVIQGAAFLMTLVRKGKISSSTYHRVYAVTLFLPLAVFGWRWWQSGSILYLALALAVVVVKRARMWYRIANPTLWGLYVLLVFVVPWPEQPVWGRYAPLMMVGMIPDARRYRCLFVRRS